MKRTCLHSITNTEENKSCEFHPAIKKTNYLRMKTNLLIIALAILFVACNQKKGINLTNLSDIDVFQKSIQLDRSEIELQMGELPEAEIAFLVSENGDKYPVQFDDLNKDGKWEVLFSLIDFKANETKFLTLSFEGTDEIAVKTNIRFAHINDPSKELTNAKRLKSTDPNETAILYQFEGPGWENDVVAFRNYFDARNGIDIFGKTTGKMILDSCGLKDGPTYHELQNWGMDILKVANSLGAGAIALQTQTGLYRIGPDCNGTFEVIKEGPLRSVLDFDFKSIQLDGNKVKLKHRISIEAGKPYYKSKIWIEGTNEAELVTGIVNLHSDTVYSKSNEQISFFYTYDNQAFDGEKLGMGIIIPSQILSVQTAPEEGEGVTQTYYVALPIIEQPVEFYFLAGWEKQNEVYSSIEGFENEMIKQSENIAVKVVLK